MSHGSTETPCMKVSTTLRLKSLLAYCCLVSLFCLYLLSNGASHDRVAYSSIGHEDGPRYENARHHRAAKGSFDSVEMADAGGAVQSFAVNSARVGQQIPQVQARRRQVTRSAIVAATCEGGFFATTLSQVRSLAVRHGGYVAAERSQRTSGVLPVGNAHLTLKIPSSELQTALSAIGNISKVTSLRQTAKEVTADVVGLERQLTFAQGELRRFQELYESSGSVQDKMALLDRLMNYERQVKSIELSLRHTLKSVEYATVQYDLQEIWNWNNRQERRNHNVRIRHMINPLEFTVYRWYECVNLAGTATRPTFCLVSLVVLLLWISSVAVAARTLLFVIPRYVQQVYQNSQFLQRLVELFVLECSNFKKSLFFTPPKKSPEKHSDDDTAHPTTSERSVNAT